MPFEQDFRSTAELSPNGLTKETAAIVDALTDEELAAAGIEDRSELRPEAFKFEQKAGTGIEVIVVTFLSKVAYDAWKEFIVPKLKERYGGAAMTPASALRSTKAAGRE